MWDLLEDLLLKETSSLVEFGVSADAVSGQWLLAAAENSSVTMSHVPKVGRELWHGANALHPSRNVLLNTRSVQNRRGNTISKERLAVVFFPAVRRAVKLKLGL